MFKRIKHVNSRILSMSTICDFGIELLENVWHLWDIFNAQNILSELSLSLSFSYPTRLAFHTGVSSPWSHPQIRCKREWTRHLSAECIPQSARQAITISINSETTLSLVISSELRFRFLHFGIHVGTWVGRRRVLFTRGDTRRWVYDS